MTDKTTYKVILDNGKPQELECNTTEELKQVLNKAYLLSFDSPHFEIYVYDSDNKDITETQFIDEMIKEIIEGKQC
jgi:hypothetical protein